MKMDLAMGELPWVLFLKPPEGEQSREDWEADREAFASALNILPPRTSESIRELMKLLSHPDPWTRSTTANLLKNSDFVDKHSIKEASIRSVLDYVSCPQNLEHPFQNSLETDQYKAIKEAIDRLL